MEPLTLQLVQSKGLRLRFKPSQLDTANHVPRSALEGVYGRITATVQLIGAICCNTQSLAAAMMIPRESLAHLITPGQPRPASLCTDSRSVLDCMTLDPLQSPFDLAASSAFIGKFIELYSALGGLPKLLPRPIRLLAWKLDSPPRIILFNGASAPAPSVLDPLTLKPHSLQKIIVNERSKRQAPSAIHTVASDASVSINIRDSVTHYAQHRLEPFKEIVATSSQPGKKHSLVQAHTLEEALACFAHPPRGHHTEIPINASICWNQSHIDPR